MSQKPFQINSQGCVQTKQNDLKSAVSERAKNTGYSINWASVKIIGQENHLLSHKIQRGHINSEAATRN